MAVRKLPRRLRKIWHKRKGQAYRIGNSLRGLWRAKRAGYDLIDWDGTVTKDGVPVVNHWPKFRKDGFRDPDRRWAKSTKIANLTYAQVKRLRAPGGYRIRAVGQRFKQAARAGVDVAYEVKGQSAFEKGWVWEKIWRANVAAGKPVKLIMTLQNLGDPLARLKAAKAVIPEGETGWSTVLLARGRKPANWDTEWAPHVDYVRGQFRR